jgi:putative transposase
MSRYRLSPTSVQEVGLLEHCAQARFVWNLAVEQHRHWRPGRAPAPGYVEQARQLTEARAEFAWLSAGSVTVQQALRDFTQAMRNFFGGTHGRPAWRKAGRHDGFRQVAVKPEGRWPVAFATIPESIPAPGNSKVVGVDRGVVVSAALSTGDLLCMPGLTAGETDRRKDWVEQTSTGLARGFDVIRVDLNIRGMTRSATGTVEHPGRNVRQKARLNRGILASGWGLLVARLEHKACGRVEQVKAAFTSLQCSACAHIAPENRKSQAVFRCVACGFACHADVNAARDIAAGRAVTARGALQPLGRAVNREPQLATSAG